MRLTLIFGKLGSSLAMSRRLLSCALASALALGAGRATATQVPWRDAPRSLAYLYESQSLPVHESYLAPITTFRLGRERYYNALEGRLELQHGVTSSLQAGLAWSFASESRDVANDLGEIERVSSSELASAAFSLKLQLSDASSDALGSAIYFESMGGPRQGVFELRLLADRKVAGWLLASNLSGRFGVAPTRNADGSDLETGWALEPALAVSYRLAYNARIGVELRAPFGPSRDPLSAPLFGGPVLAWHDGRVWGSLSVQPQLVAMAGQSRDSHLDLDRHERVEARILWGLTL